MGLLSPRLNSVFASRWKALWWSASILATAYCTVQTLPSDKNEAAKMAKIAKREKANEHKAPKNPWALNKPAGD